MRTVVSCLVLFILLSACGSADVRTAKRIVLLAPFEGRYREVGYQALYAVQLAFAESPLNAHVELVAIDDGGVPEFAVDRARSIHLDERVIAVIVVGFSATDVSVLQSLGETPVLVAGYWGVDVPVSDNVFVNVNPQLPYAITLSEEIEVTDIATYSPPYVAGELALLNQFWYLVDDERTGEIASSFSPPDENFRERYLALNQFAPQPNMIAISAYETARLLLSILEENSLLRDGVRDRLIMSGQFEEGFNTNLPLYIYRYDRDGNLLPVDRVVEEG